MELVCNELSFYPLAENGNVAEERFRQLLRTFRGANEKYGFRHIRFLINTHAKNITETQTFYEWVSTVSNRTLKDLIVGLCKSPYADELEKSEEATFLESEYKVIGGPTEAFHTPFGLPVSYIKSIPAISFDSHTFWRNRRIMVQKVNDGVSERSTFIAYNICLDDDIKSPEISEWADNHMPAVINSVDILKRYLGYTKYEVVFTADFMTQFFEWRDQDKEIFKYLLLLMKDVQLHPFTGGMGQTENLKSRNKEASKRVTLPDRLSYTLEKNVVTFIACRGHYEFH